MLVGAQGSGDVEVLQAGGGGGVGSVLPEKQLRGSESQDPLFPS